MREVKLQTYWADCDVAGIVYFAHFFRYVEMAEEELYRLAGKDRQTLLDFHQIWLPRVESHANFMAPIRNGNAIRVRMDPQFKGEKTVRLDFEILDDESSMQLSTGYVTVVCVDRKNFKATPIPDEVRGALIGFAPADS
jgi:YbgC/YbaW family acyl-CoA thioester hydrolase